MKSPSSFKLLHLAVLLICGSGTEATRIRLYNACPFPVWPAWLPNSGHPQLGKGGSMLDSWELFDVYASTGWSGKFWGRSNCQFDTVLGTGCCETGDCSNAIGCNSTYSPPATTVEFKLHRDFIDEYSVSLVEGYNLAVKVSSSNPVCLSGGCSCDLNSRCPSELLVWNSRGTPVACNSPCLAFGADEFCCEDEFLGPEKCHPTQFSLLFKECCPRAKTYPFDDNNVPLFCTAGSDYVITFCPEVGLLAEV